MVLPCVFFKPCVYHVLARCFLQCVCWYLDLAKLQDDHLYYFYSFQAGVRGEDLEGKYNTIRDELEDLGTAFEVNKISSVESAII